MKTEYIKFIHGVTNLRLSGPDRSFAIAAAVASSVADFTAVPALKSDNPSGEYIRVASMAVRDTIGALNEAAPFDLRCALELARKFWMLRYETVHARRLHEVSEGDYFCGYFNVGRNFSGEELECLNRLSVEIGTLEVPIRDILAKKQQKAEQANAEIATTVAASVGMMAGTPIGA